MRTLEAGFECGPLNGLWYFTSTFTVIVFITYYILIFLEAGKLRVLCILRPGLLRTNSSDAATLLYSHIV